jgi:hypothetical protein
MESGNYAAVQIAQALASNHIKLVPDIMAGGGADQGGLINVLLAKMLMGANGMDGNGSKGGNGSSGGPTATTNDK